MSLQTYLEQLRTKPEHVRRRFAFWTSFGITAVIFAFWLASFSMRIGSVPDAAQLAVAKTNTPAKSLVASVGAFFYDIKDIVFGPKKITYPVVEVMPGK